MERSRRERAVRAAGKPHESANRSTLGRLVLDRDQLQRVYAEIDRLERTEVKIRETVTYESHRRAWMLAALLFLLAELLGALVRPRAP